MGGGGHSLFAAAALANLLGGGTRFLLLQHWPIYWGSTRFLLLQRWPLYLGGGGHSLFAAAALANILGGGGALAFCCSSVGQYTGGRLLFAAAALANILGGGRGGTRFLLLQHWPIYCGGHSLFAAAALANILGGGAWGHSLFAAAALANLLWGALAFCCRSVRKYTGVGRQSFFAAARWPICCYDSGESGNFFHFFRNCLPRPV